MARAATAAVTAEARRWERRPDDRPRVLMASALKLLRRDGYRRVRLEDVAEDAGVSKATVYHYFANKDDLFTRSVVHCMAEKHEDIERRLARAGGSAADRIRLFLREYWTMSLSPQSGLWQRLVVSEMAHEAPEVFAAWAKGLVRRWRLVETLIKEGQANGEFRPEADAAITARLILSGLAHQALFHVHLGVSRFAPCDVDRLSESSIDFLLHGLHAPARRSSRR
jgi:AcrR family transcriptional regulator